MTDDLVVVGGGPAGLAAALTAAEGGLRVEIIDAGPALGGQIWRQARTGDTGATPPLLRAVAEHPGITLIASTSVWHAAAREGGGARLYLRGPTGQAVRETPAVVLAPGAAELSLPFPGWDLPGVVTPGAAQALLKADEVPIGQRVVVAGTGPFLWPVAAGLVEAGVQVAALVEAAPTLRSAVVTARLARHPALLRQAAGYLRRLAAARTPILTGHAVVAASGTDQVSAVTLARLGKDGEPAPTGRRDIAVDAVCVGWGFVPAVELARQLGCTQIAHPTRPLCAVAIDADQATSVAGVFAAGEITGIGGARAATAEGTIAGAAAARQLGALGDAEFHRIARPAQRRRRNARHAAAVLDSGYPLPARWTAWLTSDTPMCRCEEVTWRQVADVVAAGLTDVRAVKGQTRCGMGWCQGRICGPAVQSAAACRAGLNIDRIGDLSTRPFAVPISVGELAAVDGEGQRG